MTWGRATWLLPLTGTAVAQRARVGLHCGCTLETMKRGPRWINAASRVGMVLMVAACTGAGSAQQRDRRVAGATSLVTAESDVLSGPIDVAVDGNGNL